MLGIRNAGVLDWEPEASGLLHLQLFGTLIVC